MKQEYRFTVDLGRQLAIALEKRAKKERRHKSVVVRMILEDFLLSNNPVDGTGPSTGQPRTYTIPELTSVNNNEVTS